MATDIRYYMDENVPLAVPHGLRHRGVEALTTQEAGMLGASDHDQLALATSQGRVLFSQDVDYLILHAQGMKHSGIVFASQWTPIGEVVRSLMLIHDVLTADDMQSHIEFI